MTDMLWWKKKEIPNQIIDSSKKKIDFFVNLDASCKSRLGNQAWMMQ